MIVKPVHERMRRAARTIRRRCSRENDGRKSAGRRSGLRSGERVLEYGLRAPVFYGSPGERAGENDLPENPRGAYCFGELIVLSLQKSPENLREFAGKMLSRNPVLQIHVTANLRTKILDFRWFDSSRILHLRGAILMSIGNLPEFL